MVVLGIETSCDDTGLAVWDGEKIVVSYKTGQEEFHRRFGGIVPEIASRKHLEVLPTVFGDLLEKFPLDRIDGIAVTKGPGLIGSLLVGVKFAEALSIASEKPLVGVDHLEAHVYSIFIQEHVPFPYIALLASGGHTCLFLVEDFTKSSLLGDTRDDACGEAFDKVAKMMGLGYPGGPEVERLAKKGRPIIKLPIPDLGDSLDFSFSGLKTAVLYTLKELGKDHFPDLAASFQKTVFEILLDRVLKACEKTGVKRVVFCGGVAANRTLREALKRALEEERGVSFYAPSPYLCTDNGDMIAFLGEKRLSKGVVETPPLEVYPN